MSESLMASKDAGPMNKTAADEALEDVVARTLAECSEPIPFPKLRQQLPGPYQQDEEALQRTLDELTRRKQAHQFAPYKSKAFRYWHRPLDDYATLVLLDQASGQYTTKADLRNQVKNRLKNLSNKAIEDLIQRLARSGQLHSGSFLGSRTTLFSADPIDAKVLLDNAMERIAKLYSIPVGNVRALANSSPQPNEPPAVMPPAAETLNHDASSEVVSDDNLVLGAIAELRPGGAKIVPLAELRHYFHFRMSREAFDAAILKLERDEKVDLTTHPDPSSLNDQDRHDRRLADRGKIYDMLIVRR